MSTFSTTATLATTTPLFVDHSLGLIMMHARRLATHLRALPRPASLVRPASLSPRHVAARPFVSSLHNIAFRLYSTEQEAKPSEGAPSGAEGAEAKAGQSEAERKAAALEEKVKSLEVSVDVCLNRIAGLSVCVWCCRKTSCITEQRSKL